MIFGSDGTLIKHDIKKTQDKKGNEVIVGQFPGLNTKLGINGNIFRIVYTKDKPVFRFTAEFVKEENDK